MAVSRTLAAVLIFATALPATSPARTCFSAFGGTVFYQFTARKSDFTKKGVSDIPGVLFGALSPCAGLSFWGIVGTAVNDGKQTVLGFRQETADADTCGAVDVTVTLDPKTLRGTLQLYNERTQFGNSSDIAETACQAVPAGTPPRGRDAFGNGA